VFDSPHTIRDYGCDATDKSGSHASQLNVTGASTGQLAEVFGFVAFLVLVGLTLYLVRYGAKSPFKLSGLGLSLEVPGGGSVQLPRPGQQVVSARKIDTDSYEIDTVRGFAFLKAGPGWSPLKSGSGTQALLRAKHVKLTQAIPRATDPVTKMFRAAQFVWLTRGRTVHITLTDRSEFVILGHSRPLPPEGAGSTFDFTDEFNVTTFEKSKLGGTPLSLPQFFIIVAGQMGPTLDKLVANEDSIAAVASFTYRKVEVDGVMGDFHVDRTYKILESPTHFYVADIGHSPRTGEPDETWSEAQDMLNSFVALEPPL